MTSALVHVLSTTVSDQTKEIKLVQKRRQKDVENVVQWTTIVDKKAIEQNLIDFYFIKKHLSSLLLEGKWKLKQITVKCWKTFINTSKMSSNICTWRYKWNLKQSAGLGRDSNVQKRNNIIKSNLNGWHSKSPISFRYHSGVACFIGKRFLSVASKEPFVLGFMLNSLSIS